MPLYLSVDVLPMCSVVRVARGLLGSWCCESRQYLVGIRRRLHGESSFPGEVVKS